MSEETSTMTPGCTYYVYIVRCADNTFYTGITTNLERRIAEHNNIKGKGMKGAKYTSIRQPVHLMYSATFPDRSTASQEEYRIKKLSRKEKEVLFR